MNAKAMLALTLFLTIRAASEDSAKRQTQAQCKFSDGVTITVTYSSDRTSALKLETDGPLITVKGIDVPIGEYIVMPARDSQNDWTLTMKKQTASGETKVALPSLPMSVTTSKLRVGNFPVSFDQSGGSCMMHWSQDKSNILLSLEFAERNTDLPTITQ
jgi:hypothetical protein